MFLSSFSKVLGEGEYEEVEQEGQQGREEGEGREGGKH